MAAKRLACCKVGLDRPLIPTIVVADLFRSARVSRPDPAVWLTGGFQVTRRRSGTGRPAAQRTEGQETTARTSLYKTNFSPVLDGRAVGKSRHSGIFF